MVDMSSREAAERLGVSQRQVQRLIAVGSLSGSWGVGHALVVDPLSVSAFQRREGRRGRPWSPPVTWGALWMLSGLDAPWLTDSQRSRTIARLRTITPAHLVGATRQRAVVVRYRGGKSALDHAPESLVFTGASAGTTGPTRLSGASAVDAYCRAATERDFSRRYGLLLDRAGQIILRIPSLDRVLDDRLEMPLAVVGVDLASSFEARERAVGLEILSGLLN
jgi:hypothetical protein